MKYIDKDYTGKWNPAKDAEYVTNADTDYYSHDLSKMILYTEEPSYDETK